MWQHPPRYENSYYGPIDGILNCIFPPSQRFLVKPQAILRPSRPVVSSTHLPPGAPQHPDVSRSSRRLATVPPVRRPPHDAPSHSPNSSVDSTGDPMLSRASGGWEEDLFKPDFIVVKGTAALDRDVILALVEVKVNAQEEYTDEFVAYLCMGQVTRVWETRVQGNNRSQVMSSRHIVTGDMPFCNLLHPLRQNYWA
ncbi:hypothetical protein SCP_1102310 [Sparassis crispa]|uniref:Uncharacterized protein n=1 Tax=Sparassis crispa TaxID=139825 RepID=A0A401GZG2_9APHY|nr:hypothetical protein SCP_1102310 [Sparassis crispa]GBE87554.1 hypothetical protein SCP_1102310 [Sparassis crispa]